MGKIVFGISVKDDARDLLDKYSNFMQKMPFINKYHFHIYKTKILKNFRQKTKAPNTNNKK